MSAVRLTQSARTDLLEAWSYIAEHNLDAADGVLDTIEREALLLATQPFMGRARTELGTGLRSWPTETPYILFYETDADGITIIRVLHHARDIQTTDFSLH
jgi:toxin ParE1/3/4